eukprot:980010-Pelagomonas_calceolata.AAC.6
MPAAAKLSTGPLCVGDAAAAAATAGSEGGTGLFGVAAVRESAAMGEALAASWVLTRWLDDAKGRSEGAVPVGGAR